MTMTNGSKSQDASSGKAPKKHQQQVKLLKKAKDLAKLSDFKADCVTHCK